MHAIGMRQPPSQTVKSPEGHLVIHAPFDIQDLKKLVLLKSQLGDGAVRTATGAVNQGAFVREVRDS